LKQFSTVADVLTMSARRTCAMVVAVCTAVLAACGGSGGGGGGGGAEAPPDATPVVPAPVPEPTPAPTPERHAAARFLTQASFGPTEASIQRVQALGYAAWIDEQFALPASSHVAHWDALTAQLRTANPSAWAGQDGVFNSFWRTAVTGDDQLRQRVAFALSQIFVVSMQDTFVGNDPRAVAHYLDLLATRGSGRYRDLLEGVALHPMMGRYLSSLGNRKADTRTGRVPDENFARELMQLFSIGLHQLEPDGTRKLAGGQPIDTYGPDDISGLARVFTGWSWACPVAPTATNHTCFSTGSVTVNGTSRWEADRGSQPMIHYPGMHAPEEKRFLGVVVPPNTDGPQSLRIALDTLASHPNAAPFIGRQLIQRLVTSNPSPAYVRDVAQAFTASGGDLRAVVKAILLHPEARTPSATGGKVREPLLRMTAYFRAFNATSDGGHWRIGNTDDPATRLGQSVLRSPSVFNFYRPGYVPPNSAAAGAGLVAPELQILHETSAAGYVSYLRSVVFSGVGVVNGAPFNRADVQPDYRAELALAERPAELVALIDAKLMHGSMPAALKAEIVAAVGAVPIPTHSQAAIDLGKKVRVCSAILLTLASPEFQVQP
jgi:uncharacterized protein (DUF1800 family)